MTTYCYRHGIVYDGCSACPPSGFPLAPSARARALSTPAVGNPRARAKTTAEALDELHRSVAELSRQISVAMAQATDGLKAFGQALTRGMRRKRASVELAPVPHGFTPSLDLVCGVCGVGPEECRGGRP